jgi:hypothetical protein
MNWSSTRRRPNGWSGVCGMPTWIDRKLALE